MSGLLGKLERTTPVYLGREKESKRDRRWELGREKMGEEKVLSRRDISHLLSPIFKTSL
jgi:hypothetical protein